MPTEKFRSIDYSSQYYKSIKYLYKKGLGNYLTSFVNDLYKKSDLFTTNSSPIYKSDILSLLEESLNYSIKDLNYDRLFTKIERFRTFKNISYLFDDIHPEKLEETLNKINIALQFYNDNISFFESKEFNSSNLYHLLIFKANLLSQTNFKKEEIETKQNIIEILYHYKKEVDINYIESIELYYNSLNFDSFKIGDFKSLLYLINKYNSDIPNFDLKEVKEILEATSISQKQKTIEQISSDLELNKVTLFKQKAFCYLINYLVIPYGNIDKLKVKSSDEKKLIIHYYYTRYLLSKNSDWLWKNNPNYKLIDEKIELSSFNLVYNDLHSPEIDIKFKDGNFDFLKAKHEIIDEIIKTNNPNKSKLVYPDFLDKINYEIREHKTIGDESDDIFISRVLNDNITLFKDINSNYTDLINLLEMIYINVSKLTVGLDYYVQQQKINEIKKIVKSKLNSKINIDDLFFRILICYDLEDLNNLKDYVEKINSSKKITLVEHIKLLNRLNFLEYDLFIEQNLSLESNKSKFVNNDLFLPLATKAYNFFISNIDYFNDYNDYIRIIELIKKFNFEPDLQLINKYLSFYNTPGNMLTNRVKFTLDQNMGELYFKIKNYKKARLYFYDLIDNPYLNEDLTIAIQKWDILMNIYYCEISDYNLPKEEVKKTIIYIKEMFEFQIDKMLKIKSDNMSRMLNEITYKYNIICLYETREQKDLIKEKKILLEQLEINKSLHLFNDFYNELDLIKCKSKLNEISKTESFKLISNLYIKYNKKQDISFALSCEELKDYNSSFNIQLNTYSDELINNLNYINKLSFINQIIFFNEIWDHRQFILRTYFKLSEEEKQKNLNRLIDFFILSDNVDGNNSNLYTNNETEKINELIIEKKKLFNIKSVGEDYIKISNNIDLLQQKLKFNKTISNWNLKSLKDNLKENQAYIRIFSSNGYFAFIVNKTTTILIDLNEDKIDFKKSFNAYMKNLKEQIESPIAYDIFYSKIFNALPKEANELFFQNEGVYINLNPDGFKSNSSQKYLIEDYNIHSINSSYLFNNLDREINFENALFIGNPKFQTKGSQLVNASITDNNTRGSLLPLPNTQNEVLEVAKLLNNESINSKCLLQGEATEENLNNLSSTFDLIHIATHGFYKDDGADKINQFDWGLYLTGALDYINNNQATNKMIDEGIVYGPEIELLNLSKTKLVVLSACETGFGRQSTMGKISLSSSFIMAGAKNVLSTLWKVDDKVTMEFISEFYKNLLQIKNIKSALRKTQLEFLEKYKSPYYWAPFMLLQNRG